MAVNVRPRLTSEAVSSSSACVSAKNICRVSRTICRFCMSLDVREQDCGSCVCFKPHHTHGYFGVCSVGDKLVVRTPHMRICKTFRKLSAEELKKALVSRGSLYCLSCRKPLFTAEELDEHLGHVIGLDFCTDDVAREEAPPAS